MRAQWEAMDAAMREAAAAAGATFVEVLGPSEGHDICAGDDAWVNGFEAQPGVAAAYHPLARRPGGGGRAGRASPAASDAAAVSAVDAQVPWSACRAAVRRRPVLAAVALLAALTLTACDDGPPSATVGNPDPSTAAPGTGSPYPTYVALGDSYTAAPGVPQTEQETGCLRSNGNYANLVANQLKSRLRRRQLLRGQHRLADRRPAHAPTTSTHPSSPPCPRTPRWSRSGSAATT